MTVAAERMLGSSRAPVERVVAETYRGKALCKVRYKIARQIFA
jgi:hypothetical protein